MLTTKTLRAYAIAQPDGLPILGQEERFDGTTGLMYWKLFPTKEMAELAHSDMSRVNDDGTWDLEQRPIIPVSISFQIEEEPKKG